MADNLTEFWRNNLEKRGFRPKPQAGAPTRDQLVREQAEVDTASAIQRLLDEEIRVGSKLEKPNL